MKNNADYPSKSKQHFKNYTFFEKHPIIPSVSIYNTLKILTKFYKDNIALDCLKLQVTYSELLSNANILSKSFTELGIKKDDIVAVCMPNFTQAVCIFFAVNRLGAITTFLNPNSNEKENIKYLNEYEAKLLINYNKNYEHNHKIKNNTKLDNIITLSSKDLNKKNFNEVSNTFSSYNDFISYSDLKIVSNYNKHLKNTYNAKALILYTSGSTGLPKKVVLTNKNVLASGIYMKNTSHLKIKENEKSMITIPFCYPYGFVTSLLMSLLCGRNSILTPYLSQQSIEYYLKKQPNYIFGCPAILEFILKINNNKLDLSSISDFITGGDFLPENKYNDALQFFYKHNSNINICNGSGNAETAGANTITFGSKIKKGTVGKALVGSDVIIVNPDTLEEMKYNEVGMLCVSGKHVFEGYYNDKKLTDEKFIYKNNKKYFKTENYGYLDKEGYFTLIGRTSRFYINSNINKVYCENLQSIINKLPYVSECAVVPKPDDEKLYVSKAYVVLKEKFKGLLNTKDIIINELHNFNDENSKYYLKEYEFPESIEIVDYIPLTNANKIDYKLLENKAVLEYNKEKNKIKKLIKE